MAPMPPKRREQEQTPMPIADEQRHTLIHQGLGLRINVKAFARRCVEQPHVAGDEPTRHPNWLRDQPLTAADRDRRYLSIAWSGHLALKQSTVRPRRNMFLREMVLWGTHWKP